MLRCALAAVPMACAVLLSSCYGDEYGDCPATGGDAVPVKVNVSAGVIGDLNGSRAGGDVNAEEHEFINTLYVYIVKDDNGTPRVYDNISPDLTADASAQGGNLTSWTSETFTLDPGTYTFYAFANIDNYVGEYGSTGSTTQKTGKQLLDDCFGASTDSNFELRDGDLNQFRLLDPAGEIDLDKGKYIPMSAVGTITVNGDLNASGGIVVDLPLERLVGKIRLTVSDGADVTDNSEVTFFGYSENVPLMEGSTSSDYYGDRTGEFTAKLRDAEDTADGRLFSFYVNETPEGLPFTVTLATGNTTGVTTYTASPRRRILPRNSIYPLTLTFTGGNLDLVPAAYLQVTGVPAYKVEYDVDYTTGTYTFGIAYGSYLTIIPSIQNAQGTPQFTWNVPTQNPAGMAIPDKEEAESVGLPTLADGGFLCSISAGEGYYGKSYAVTLNAVWTGTDGNNYNRTYNVIVKTSQDYDTVLDGIIDNLNLLSGRTRSVVTKVNPERLYMVKTK